MGNNTLISDWLKYLNEYFTMLFNILLIDHCLIWFMTNFEDIKKVIKIHKS